MPVQVYPFLLCAVNRGHHFWPQKTVRSARGRPDLGQAPETQSAGESLPAAASGAFNR
jgi:hypothetical protein